MAPDSGLRPGGDRQREPFYHEVQGWDRGTSGPAGATGALPSVAITNVCYTFQLVDMSEELWQVYNRLDPVSLNASLTQVTSWDF